jgi:tetrapyrrole methylase family protein/MazG family protein
VENSKLAPTHSFLDDLIRLVKTLRGKHGCPWDQKQTPRNAAVYLIEEVFELVDAIEIGNPEHIREELGDVLFHIVFIARMFQELGKFDLSDVAQSITEKMIRRHPHVFAEENVKTSEEIVENWHKIKLSENKSTGKQSSLDSVPAQLPALIRAYRISDRLAKTGFDWLEVDDALENVEQELAGLK